MLRDRDAERARQVIKAMLQMKKFDIAGLKEACQQSREPP
jgi:hypothetical protein